MQGQTRLTDNDELPEVVAYLYETQTENYADDWSLVIRDIHPNEIQNAEARNVIRLARIEEMVDDPDPVGTEYELGESPDDTTTHYSISLINEPGSYSDIWETTQLAPIAEDRDVEINPPPIEPHDVAVYFTHSNNTVWYKIYRNENSAKRISKPTLVSSVLKTSLFGMSGNYVKTVL
jgi:hypothetical protein